MAEKQILLSVVIPAFNEAENIPELHRRLKKVLRNIPHEIIVVDDNSPDGTYDVVLKISGKDPSLIPVRRIHEKGLSSAVIHGFTMARGKYLVVMDGDLQHDEKIIPAFVADLNAGSDVVIGSRKVEGGGYGDWSPLRRFISWGATVLARIMLPRTVSDPMSGFFAVRKDLFEKIADRINPRGFKILLEIITRSGKVNVTEVGYVFGQRLHGESKLSGAVMLQYLIALYDLRFGRILPVRFIKFGLVGVSGILVNQGGLFFGINVLHWADRHSVLIGIESAIFSNFLLNNYWTFRDVKIRGFLKLIRGFLLFNAICATGALIQYAIFMITKEKWGINVYAANLLGIVVSAAWNYVFNFQITWKQK